MINSAIGSWLPITPYCGLVALRDAQPLDARRQLPLAAAEKGYIGICWTNSIAVMPPWGAKECRIGTNPLIVAIPPRQSP